VNIREWAYKMLVRRIFSDGGKSLSRTVQKSVKLTIVPRSQSENTSEIRDAEVLRLHIATHSSGEGKEDTRTALVTRITHTMQPHLKLRAKGGGRNL